MEKQCVFGENQKDGYFIGTLSVHLSQRNQMQSPNHRTMII